MNAKKKIVFLVMIAVLAISMMGMAPLSANAAGPVCRTFYRTITGDRDSGIGSYWATLSYISTVTICTGGEGEYVGDRNDGGNFTTFGGLSPSGNDTVGAGVQGTINGTWTGIKVTGTIKPNLGSDLGTVDFGCNQTGVCSNYTSTLSKIFEPGFIAIYPDTWAWNYQTCDGKVWDNSAAGNSGDITGDPVSCSSPKEFAHPDLPNDAAACCAPNTGHLTPTEMMPGPNSLSIFSWISEPCAKLDTVDANGVSGNWIWDHQGWRLNSIFDLADVRHKKGIASVDFSAMWAVQDANTGKWAEVFHPAVLDPASGKWVLEEMHPKAILFAGHLEGPFSWTDFNDGKYTRLRDSGVSVNYFSVTNNVIPE